MIQAQLEQIVLVTHMLADKGIAVLHARANGFERKPVIEVARSPELDELSSVHTTEVDERGRRQKMMVATIGNCTVQWRAE